MKWLRWLPRRFTPGGVRAVAPASAAPTGSIPDGTEAIRPVGECESCGCPISARTRHAAFRGRADCACGHRNHVEFREVRTPTGTRTRHVSVTRGRQFETSTHEPDLRLAYRFGVCPNCTQAVRLLDAHVISSADSTGSLETFAYYCPGCHLHDDIRRGRLDGNDGEQIQDRLRYALPPGIA